jgi:hypothetical protein
LHNKFKVKLKSNIKKLTVKIKKIKDWIKENRHIEVKELIEKLNLRLVGHIDTMV